ncbi:MAG: OB-fold nucleic acid binding domain-containing protein, partial [Paracoccus sp. (in: a-proteobacteria)]|nr:OB-fold nucleic acid binding domain-containing protein [Paracoccus sp. (in: a-proteobacteria)]
FLRDDLTRRRIRSCAAAMAAPNRSWIHVAGLVLVRQRPGSAKGVMFITLEDETGIANLVLWPKVFEAHRRIVLGAGMIGVEGRVQRAGEVVHLVAHRLADLSADLAGIGRQGDGSMTRRPSPNNGPDPVLHGDAHHRQPGGKGFPLPHGRGDEFHRGPPPSDPRHQGPKPRDIHVPDLRTKGIAVRPRDFR